MVLDTNRDNLSKLLSELTEFLDKELSLSMHPNKVYIRKFSQGIDFLGYVIFPHFKVLRTKTKRRVLSKVKILKSELDKGLISKESFDQSIASYYGLLIHCRGNKIKKDIHVLSS